MSNLVRSDNAKDLTAVWDALKQVPRDALSMDQLEQLVATAESGDIILANMEKAGGAIAAAAQGAHANSRRYSQRCTESQSQLIQK